MVIFQQCPSLDHCVSYTNSQEHFDTEGAAALNELSNGAGHEEILNSDRKCHPSLLVLPISLAGPCIVRRRREGVKHRSLEVL